MNEAAESIRAAVALFLTPSGVRIARDAPLPENIISLLKIAARDATEIDAAAKLVERPSALIEKAATFYVEQVVLAPQGDSYRTLASRPDASIAELRRNMALLLKCVHPDIEANAEQSVYAARVTKAWDDVKTPEKRALYDAAQQKSAKETRSAHADAARAMAGLSRSRRTVRWGRRKHGSAGGGLLYRFIRFLSTSGPR